MPRIATAASLSAQRLSASLNSTQPACRASARRASCAQRLSASLNSTHCRAAVGTSRDACAQRLSASLNSTHLDRRTALDESTECSTPFGITEFDTALLVNSIRLEPYHSLLSWSFLRSLAGVVVEVAESARLSPQVTIYSTVSTHSSTSQVVKELQPGSGRTLRAIFSTPSARRPAIHDSAFQTIRCPSGSDGQHGPSAGACVVRIPPRSCCTAE